MRGNRILALAMLVILLSGILPLAAGDSFPGGISAYASPIQNAMQASPGNFLPLAQSVANMPMTSWDMLLKGQVLPVRQSPFFAAPTAAPTESAPEFTGQTPASTDSTSAPTGQPPSHAEPSASPEPPIDDTNLAESAPPTGKPTLYGTLSLSGKEKLTQGEISTLALSLTGNLSGVAWQATDDTGIIEFLITTDTGATIRAQKPGHTVIAVSVGNLSDSIHIAVSGKAADPGNAPADPPEPIDPLKSPAKDDASVSTNTAQPIDTLEPTDILAPINTPAPVDSPIPTETQGPTNNP